MNKQQGVTKEEAIELLESEKNRFIAQYIIECDGKIFTKEYVNGKF